MQAEDSLVLFLVRFGFMDCTVGIQSVDDAVLVDLLICDLRVGVRFDWEHFFTSLCVQRAKTDDCVDEGLIRHVEGGGDTLGRIGQPILKNTWPLSRKIRDKIRLIEICRVNNEKDEVSRKEATKECEEMHA